MKDSCGRRAGGRGTQALWRLMGLATALCLGLASGSAMANSLDDYTMAQTAKATVTGTTGVSDSTATGIGTILGGQRDILSVKSAGGSSGYSNVTIGSGALVLGVPTFSTGSAQIQWDGSDQTIALNPVGLGGVDVTNGGAVTALATSFTVVDQAFRYQLQVYTSATRYSIVELQATPVTASGPPLPVSVSFSTFAACGSAASGSVLSVTCGPDGPADFRSVGAVQLLLNTPNASGARVSALDVAMTPITFRGAIGDRVFEDRNGDGVQNCTDANLNGILGDTGDVGDECNAGLPNVPVSLYPFTNGVCDTSALPLGTTTTDANGFYLFDNLDAGSYCVRFTPPTTLCADGTSPVFTTPLIGNPVGNTANDSNANPQQGPQQGLTGSITLAAGQVDRTVDAGLYCPAKLGDYLWDDWNRNGIQDEPVGDGVNGQNVFLLNCAGQSVTDAAGNTVMPFTTANDASGRPGYYLFGNLKPGCYQVQFSKPDGFVFTTKNAVGATAANDSDADAGTGRTTSINLASRAVDLSWDAGIYLPIKPKLGDFLWEDKNGNGKQDVDEPGINGGTVTLYDCSGKLITTTVTGPDASGNPGFYAFNYPDVMPNGCYQVRFTEPTNYCAGATFTTPLVGDATLDSDAPVSAEVNLSLPDNLINLTVDAGVICPAALGNYLWNDYNRNGVQDELPSAGINGQTVSLLDCDAQPVTNINGAPVNPVQTANGTNGQPGYYQFNNLKPGCYVVEFAKPSPFVFTLRDQGGDDALDSDADKDTGRTGPIDLPSGVTDLTRDAGVYEPIDPLIGDFLWDDKNGNGLQDPGEPGINGATVNLRDCSGNLVATTTTANDGGNNPGYYSFTTPNLTLGGCYKVEFVTPTAYCEGARFTTRQVAGGAAALNSDGPLSDEVSISAPNALKDLTIDAGIVCPAGLGDYVWEDLNRDGIQNELPSAGLNGVRVDLLDPGTDGLCNTGDEGFLQTTVTADKAGAPGYYAFAPLNPGHYCVQITRPTDYVCTDPNVGPGQPSPYDSDMVPVSGVNNLCQTKDEAEDPIVLTSGEFDETWDAGLLPAALGDYVWEDLNFDGVQDGNEPGIPGVTLTLAGSDGSSFSTTTDATGKYLFPKLVPGVEYTATCVKKAGYDYTPFYDQGRADGTNSNANDAGNMGSYTLAAGEALLTVDCGLVQGGDVPNAAALGDYVWVDTNGNGLQDDGQTGLSGVTVRLNGSDGSTRTQETGSAGDYLFTNLIPGVSYTAQCVAPAGYTYTSTFNQDRTLGTNSNANPANGGMGTFTLAGNEALRTVDCGLVPLPAALGDYVWNDLNGNGQQDDGPSAGMSGVIINLTGSDGSTRTQTTGSAGAYLFEGLKPGVQYTAQCVAPPGYTYTSTFDQDRAAGNNSNANPATNGGMGSFTLGAGETLPTVDCGLVRIPSATASLGDWVWNDLNKNGQQDSGEPGLAGSTVTLWQCGPNGEADITKGTNTLKSQVTGSNGQYLFNQLAPGCYFVTFTTPAGGFTPTAANVGADATDSDAVNGVTGPYTLAEGQSNLTVDAGFYATPPGLILEKTVNKPTIAPYEMVTYSYKVTNTGGTTLTNVVVTDDNGTPANPGDDFTVGTIPSLAPGASVTLTAGVIPVVTTTSVGYGTGSQITAGAVVVVVQQADGNYKVTYLQDFAINDNTYGTGSIGWPVGKPHTFGNLTGSDKLEFRFFDKTGNVVLDFYVDTITAATSLTRPDTKQVITYASGYGTLGPFGGDGSMVAGDSTNLVSFSTSITENLNHPLNLQNKASLIVNSPTSLVNGQVVVNPTAAPGGWNAINTYTVVVKASAFGAAGFGGVTVPDQHNSPNKLAGDHGMVTQPKNSTVVNTAKAVTASSGGLTATATASVNIVAPASPPSQCAVTEVDPTFDKKEVRWSIKNGGKDKVTLNEVTVTWPAANGFLDKVKFDADVVWDGKIQCANGTCTATLPSSVLVTDAKKKSIDPGKTRKLTFVFEKNASKDLLLYSASASFGSGCEVTFGTQPVACHGVIGNFVWDDLDGNGLQDAGEPGIDNVTLTLKQGTTVKGTATTDVDGAYLFTEVCGGTYTVEVARPNGYVATLTRAGVDDGIDSNPNPETVVMAGDSDSDLTIDFGFVNTGGTEMCVPAATAGQPPVPVGTLFVTDLGTNIGVRYEQSRTVNDNTYGTNIVGWGRTHTFNDLVGSDKAEFIFTNGAGTKVLDFYLDYISSTTVGSPKSGYASLGAAGGDGSCVTGSCATNLVSWNSSLARNLNERGFCTGVNACTFGGVNLLTNSPPVSPAGTYNTSASFSAWDFTNSYEVVVKKSAFGTSGFGAVKVGIIHNSPAKTGSNAITPTPCP